MLKLEQIPSTLRPRKVTSTQSQFVPDVPNEDEELSDTAIRAIAEGRADHAAGRTFTLAEVKRELGIEL